MCQLPVRWAKSERVLADLVLRHAADSQCFRGSRLRVEAKQRNARGTVHGGIFATLADVALGYTLPTASTPPANLVTANLTA